MARQTLLDQSKTVDASGKTMRIVEMLNETNEVIDHMEWYEANGVDGHTTTVRTGIPTPVWRMFNQGVTATKSETAQVTEGVGMMHDRSELDVDLAKRGGDLAAQRLQNAAPHFEGMNQEFSSTLFYGNTTTAPQEFHGLSNRYSSLSAANGENIINGGGTGSDNMSIWLIVWGPTSVFGIYPKGSMAGLEHRDLGEMDVYDSDNKPFRAYVDEWKWHCGVVLADWRFAVRIANLDVSELSAGTGPDLTELMIQAELRVPSLRIGRAVWYMNRTAEQYLEIQRLRNVSAGGGLNYSNVDGKRVRDFRGTPVSIVDQLLVTEAAVS